MKRLFLPLSFILLTSASFAQSITGDWYGLLTVPGAKLHVVFHIVKNGSDYKATMDSPDQKASGIPLDKVSFADNKLTLDYSAANMTYTGTFLPDSNKINGIFHQGPSSFPLILTHDQPVLKTTDTSRPQDPKDFPYKREEVAFTNPKAGNQLAGTLTLPSNGKATKIVILITGSGAQDRNEEIVQFNHRPFLVWSDWLTRNGIAVLRYDDRGVGKSTGNAAAGTSADFADDAEAGVNYIKSRPDLKQLSIGLIGHSEGGMIAPMVASRNKDVNFIVLLAGPGIPCAELMVRQSEDQMRLSGAADSTVNRSVNTNKQVYAAIQQYKELSAPQLKLKIDSTLYKEFSAYPKAALGNRSVEQLVAQSSANTTSPWFRYFINYKPADYLVKVKCAVLALNGTLDKQVSAEPNLAGIRSALEKGKNKHFEIVPVPGLNHLFQKAVTGSVAEYEQLTETVNPAALNKVSSWISQL